ncbi:MAG TPA: STT3 domain-containing protein [Bryobacteraceae bacterium]|jgi:dolichyl-diphosphooligosaccharide--protein glycosyltransferase|nr:STT3 domain-containing protein [Bryobacteraceae bacterium]
MRNRGLAPAPALFILVLALGGLALRVLPSYAVVSSAGGVRFQESDAWFHVRSVHNLLAHFPRRSTFDPAAIFPGGQEVPTGPAWDYLLAIGAWMLGLGSPTPGLIDRVAAWLPAILGALFVIPAYGLARRLDSAASAAFAALWAAVMSGAFLWITHFGLADHHAAEALLAFLSLYLLCRAVPDIGAKVDFRFAAAAGIALGLYFLTRPAGVFVCGILCVAAVWNATVALAVAPAAAIAAAMFAPASHVLWGDFALLGLTGTAAVAAAMAGVNAVAMRRGWGRRTRAAIVLGGAALCALAVAVLAPRVIGSLWFQVRRVAGFTASSRMVQTVQELQPLYRAGMQPGWASVVEVLGTVWIPASPALVWLLFAAWRRRGPVFVLPAVWSVTVAAATVLQARMVVYFAPMAAVLAGICCARLAALPSGRMRAVAAGAVALTVLAVNLPAAFWQMRADSAPSEDWQAAADWLKSNTPEPFADPAVWSALSRGPTPASTPQWGVALWWPYGYFIEQAAHRVPMSNGTQAGAEEMARFFISAFPEVAVPRLRAAGARYVIVDPEIPWFVGANRSSFPAALIMLGRDTGDFVRVLYRDTASGLAPVPVYLPEYYRSMAARLYLADGQPAAGSHVSVFQTESRKDGRGRTIDVIVWSKAFSSEREAMAYVEANHGTVRLTAGCVDPGHSCVPLDAVPGLRRVFTSDPGPISPERRVRAVKIFELNGR